MYHIVSNGLLTKFVCLNDVKVLEYVLWLWTGIQPNRIVKSGHCKDAKSILFSTQYGTKPLCRYHVFKQNFLGRE